MKIQVRFHAGLLAASVLLGAAGPAAAQGRFQVQYVQPPAEIEPLIAAIREAGVIEAAADHVSTALQLPRDVPIVFDTCGQPNAFYDPDAKAISFCYEFVGMFAQIFVSAPDITQDEIAQGIVGSTLFFMLHEMGHSLVDVLDLPITGREEDAVDDLAALIMIDAEASDDLLAAIESFDTLANGLEESDEEVAYWDEHSLDIQRAYALDCVVYGSDPQEYGDLVRDDRLPESRAVRCPEEFEQKSESWDRLLWDYYVPERRQ